MHPLLRAELTNMVLIENPEGKVLLQKRTKKDWPGWTLPGGHVEKGETLAQSIQRETLEETGLSIPVPELMGIMEFKKVRDEDCYLVFLYRAKAFTGTLKDSSEGHLAFWDIPKVPLSDWAEDMDAILDVVWFHKATQIVFEPQKDGSYVRKLY